jgi:antiviral helicase SKI2
MLDIPSVPINTDLFAQRDPQTGKIIDFVEETVKDAGSTAKNSTSMLREPGPIQNQTRGSTLNYFFWPGGFEKPEDLVESVKIDDEAFERDLLWELPGVFQGIEFSEPKAQEVPETIDLLAALDSEGDLFAMEPEATEKLEKTAESEEIPLKTQMDDSLLEIQRPTSSVIKIQNVKQSMVAEWAEIIDISQPVHNFHQKITDPAHTYQFELDTFQKQAILKLEDHDHVFVAAHTSAGKTVVAEYAIALSKKHMTKAIYTSPIKALSNQKYRDFKMTFKDVGLITGDIQIDPTANCLIMTTEILRSMLYCGSDVTRDLEYVIFDEVHYINDADRGHVWEEVLILLPDHVCIVMLSATVPNYLEFANWVGKTKRKKVYVISTAKRPIPLQHYLYTGSGSKSKDDIFLLVDENGKFRLDGYEKAKSTKLARQKDHQKNFGARTTNQLNPKQEQTMWVALIDHLQRNNKLPVVAFTLSRNRCDSNAEALKSSNLCNAREKFKIHSFFRNCIQKLKPEDRDLPQVKTIEDSLERGIGVHHSGILPILKEIVEMLFQCGLVKLLFATETFAMGVNMPARTVIFDAITKFDGKTSRNLEPAEYTQMAGRAGRRGIDSTGTVIIICKGDVPHEEFLRRMILGKPTRMESQFRLTYAMILSLLRVERVSVEDMMSHSFAEFGKQLKVPENKEELLKAEEKLRDLKELSEHQRPLAEFFVACREYFDLVDQLMPKLLGQQKLANELKPGRILVISSGTHYNKLGILLATHKETSFKVLVHVNKEGEQEQPFDELWHRMLGQSSKFQEFQPDLSNNHTVLTIKPQNILKISRTQLKCEQEKVIQNWEQRQIPRFKDSPAGQSVIRALGDLRELSKNQLDLDFLPLKSQDLTLSQDCTKMEELKTRVDSLRHFTNIPSFLDDFRAVFDRKVLEEKRENLLFQLSHKNLSLYPDYCNKLKVLRKLKYIDDSHQVSMKGRVACEMGQNELLITELVMRNLLTDLQPVEIAALLSGLVFQAKTDVDPEVPKNLVDKMKEFEEVDADIRTVETEFNVAGEDDAVAKDKLNFGLIQVVYEWGRNKVSDFIFSISCGKI